ncbi:MAG: hypothetical protein WDN47_03565 [Candidatus Doudnabacteria bacterium]
MATKNKHLVLKTGLGLAAVATAAATYYFFGKDGAKHRKSAAAWMNKAKREVVAEIRKLKEINEKNYNLAAQKVMKKYQKFQKENPEAYAMLAKELKANWSKIKKHLPKKVNKLIASKTSAKRK